MKRRKTLLASLAVVLASFMFAGCSSGGGNSNEGTSSTETTETKSGDNSSTSGKPLLVRYVVPGTEPKDSPEVDKLITEKMQKDGLNLEFHRIYIPWDVWQQKTNIMMSTGEEFELIHIMKDVYPTANYVSKSALVPLNDLLDKYGETLKSIITPEIWDIASVNGQIFEIPVMFRDFAQWNNAITIQKQLLDKYNLPVPSTKDDLLNSISTVVKNEKDPDLHVYFKTNLTTPDSIHRDYESFPFIVRDNLFFIDNEGQVKPWLKSDEFKNDSAFYRKLYTSGITHPDALTLPHEISSKMSEGKSPMDLFSNLFERDALKKKFPQIEYQDVIFNPEKPSWRGEWAVMNSNGISSTSPHPEAGVMFFNWLYSNQENYDLLNYGIKGKHWNPVGDRELEWIESADPSNPDYSFGDWEIGHHSLVRVIAGASDELKQAMFDFDPKAINSIATGFTFDSSKVTAEYTNVLAEVERSVFPIKYGIVDYETGYPGMIKAMESAGYDKVVEEYKQQFDAWLKQKKE
ncbi:ABC transporter substrate-binding protein [Paenibacillus silvisoli]|uniref:ABC transporter substrate-binding protein n=1 Tax=Paenibacillus silvisoli TaxID=3110539 RepID=UPI00280588B7|nr:ABC transporter substrate-binding protein [Paenibacillus silvisoli]